MALAHDRAYMCNARHGGYRIHQVYLLQAYTQIFRLYSRHEEAANWSLFGGSIAAFCSVLTTSQV